MKIVFVDVDDVLLKSKERFCELYNEKYVCYDSERLVPKEIKEWNFGLEEDIVEEIFSEKDFYKKKISQGIEFYSTCNVLEEIRNPGDIYILISAGVKENLDNKYKLIEETFPELFQRKIYCCSKGSDKADRIRKDLNILSILISVLEETEKNFITLDNVYFLDDNSENFINMDQRVKKVVCRFSGKTEEWNRDISCVDEAFKIYNPEELTEILVG